MRFSSQPRDIYYSLTERASRKRCKDRPSNALTQHLVLDVIGYDFLFFERFNSAQVLNKTARDKSLYATKRAKTFRFVLDVGAGTAVNVT